MRRLACILLLVLTLPGAARGQGSYQLRTPDMEEYLAAVPDVVQHGDKYVVRAIHKDLARYGDLGSAPFDVLYAAYQALKPVDVTAVDFDQWPTWVIFAWLREYRSDLADVQALTIGDMRVHLHAIDLDANGQDEWVFDIQSSLYSALWVVAADDRAPSGYRRIETPLPAFSDYCPFRTACGGRGQLVGIEDVNADGLPEVLVSVGQCGYGRCAAMLHILAWRDGLMRDLVEDTFASRPVWEMGSGGGGVPSSPPEGTWTFQNTDRDAARELIQAGQTHGSMDCQYGRMRVFSWDSGADQYAAGPEHFAYEDSSGCALRQAHLALLRSDYEAAIDAYQLALILLPEIDGSEVRQYVGLQLASAYAMYGQADLAAERLEQLMEQPPVTVLMERMREAAYANRDNPVALCRALYESIRDYDFWGDTESCILSFGQINDYAIPMTYNGGDYGPLATGCNLLGLLARHAEQLELGQNPDETLRALGWPITTAFRSDLNTDGQEDWLLWVAPLRDNALVLISVATGYRHAVVYLPTPSAGASFEVRPAPTSDGRLIVQRTPSADMGCPEPEQAQQMNLYRVTAADAITWEPLGAYTLCGNSSLDTVLLDRQTFRAWVWEPDCDVTQRIEVTYGWDEESQSFFHQVPPACPRAAQADSQTNCLRCGIAGWEFCVFYDDGEGTIQCIDALLARPPAGTDENLLRAVRYMRASLLARLSRDDEALAEFVAIYEQAPKSSWGLLAMLHLAPSENSP